MNTIKYRANLRRESSVDVLPLPVSSIQIGWLVELRKDIVFELQFLLDNLLVVLPLLLDFTELLHCIFVFLGVDIPALYSLVKALGQKLVSLP